MTAQNAPARPHSRLGLYLPFGALALAIVVMVVAGYQMWWRRRPEEGMGAPPPVRDWVRNAPLWLIGITLLLGWWMPVLGVSLAVWLEPADAELKVSLAWAEIMSGNNEAALKTALAALDQDAGDAAAHEARLTALSNLGRFAELIEAYDGARTAGLEGASLELAAGKAQLELGAADRALAHFERAGKMDPEDAEAQVGCALAQIGLGSKDKAQACLERVRTLAPDHPALAEVQAGIESLEDDAPRQDPAP